ncbi:MAG: Gldg family protein [Verrucomicrobiales bacterium]|nr:Gldg family protein [Verrucomicrobiales bacterium]
MADTPPSPSAAENGSSGPAQIQRRKIGLNVALQMLLGLILFGLANYLGYRHYRQWDRTYDREFTLDEPSLKFLKVLDRKIEITVISKRGSLEQQDVWSLVEQYQRNAKSKIRKDLIDPDQDLQAFIKVSEEAARHRIKLDDMGVFLRVSGAKSKGADGEPLAGGATFIRQGSLFRYSGESHSRRVVSQFLGEAKLTNAMMGISRGDRPKIYVVTGKTSFRMSQGGGNAVTTIADITGRQNMEMLPLDLSTEAAIPEDASGLILLGPETDLNEREAAMLRQYWQGKRHSLLITLGTRTDYATPQLDQFLTENGILPQQDRVMKTYGTATGNETMLEVQAKFSAGSPITQSQADTVTALPYMTRSIKLDTSSDRVRAQNIDLRPLLTATDGYWGETSYHDKVPVADERDNTKAPVVVAASAERGASREPNVSVDSSRLVVVGNSSLLDPDLLAPANHDFINSAIQWMLQRENYIGINPKNKSVFRLSLSEQQQSRVFLITTVVLPLVVFIFGFVVWGLRRS